MRIIFYIYLLLTLAGPLYVALSGTISFTASYLTANRDSIKIAPDPAITKDAVVQIYAARAFNWRGLFSAHTWIALKPQNAPGYTVLQVVGWRLYRGLDPVSITTDLPDRRWFDQDPQIILDIRGEQATAFIDKILTAAKAYPYSSTYVTWPGPNSNTFIADIARATPELQLVLPSNAVGKDFLNLRHYFAPTPSHTGYQFSLLGLFGIMFAQKEGFELNLFGLVYGYSPAQKLLKLPGFGDIPLSKPTSTVLPPL